MDTHPAATEKVDAWQPAPRHISAEQMTQFERYMAEILAAMGLPLDTPATRDTPKRFLRSLYEITEGYEGDPSRPMGRGPLSPQVSPLTR